MDKIGDLVLSLGVDQHPSLSNRDITWLVPKGLEFLMDASSPERKYFTWDKVKNKLNYESLVLELKKRNFDEAVFFQGEKWVMKALKAAGIPIRVGQKSSLHSFLYLNKAVRQKRSVADRNEFQYNQELCELGLDLDRVSVLMPTVLEANGELPKELAGKNYLVVHAGMGGSALNWSQEKYIAIIELLLRKSENVVLTGTDQDMKYLDLILKRFSAEEKVFNFVGKLTAVNLLTVLQEAKSCLAPSTGVLHLAAALKTKCVGLYPPIRVQSATRWGAYGEQVVNVSPEVNCPEVFDCRGKACQYYPCMESMTAEKILGELDR